MRVEGKLQLLLVRGEQMELIILINHFLHGEHGEELVAVAAVQDMLPYRVSQQVVLAAVAAVVAQEDLLVQVEAKITYPNLLGMALAMEEKVEPEMRMVLRGTILLSMMLMVGRID